MKGLSEEVKRPKLKIKEVVESKRDLPIKVNSFMEEEGSLKKSLGSLTDIIALESDSISNFFAPFNPHKLRVFNSWELRLIFGEQYD